MAADSISTKRSVPCEACPLRKNPLFREFEPKELDFVTSFKSGELTADAGATLLLDGTHSAHLYTILTGTAFRYKSLADGRRQILNFAMPGDFIGLQGSVVGAMEHSVEALTDMVLCVFPREKLWDLYNRFPSLAFDVTWLAAREEQILDEHLLSVGRRNAVERIAYLLLHLQERAAALGMTSGTNVGVPMTQQHLADTLGLSLVHTNKTLRKLVAQKAIAWKDRGVTVLDRDKLVKIARFEADQEHRRPLI